MNTAVRIVALAACLSLLGGLPGAAWAVEDRCRKYAHIRSNQRTVLSTRPARLCSMEVMHGTNTISQGVAIDSPDGTPTHAQARYVSEVSAGAAGYLYITGAIDRVTEFGLAIESNRGEVFVSWDDF